jgi:hypothetical protein
VIGDDAAPVVASGFGTVDRPFAELVGEAAVVTVEEGDDGVVVACGVAQGRLSGDGGLAFPLSAPDGRETSGFVVLSVGGAAPESTDAAIYLLVAE